MSVRQPNVGTGGGGAVSSVSNSDGSLIISPTTGIVVASIATTHANTWTANQIFNTITNNISNPSNNGFIHMSNGSTSASLSWRTADNADDVYLFVDTDNTLSLTSGANTTGSGALKLLYTSKPSNPASNKVDFYCKSDLNFYSLNYQGTEILITPPLTTVGDLAGFSSITTQIGRLPVGTNGYALTADSSATFGFDWKPITATSSGSQNYIQLADSTSGLASTSHFTYDYGSDLFNVLGYSTMQGPSNSAATLVLKGPLTGGTANALEVQVYNSSSILASIDNLGDALFNHAKTNASDGSVDSVYFQDVARSIAYFKTDTDTTHAWTLINRVNTKVPLSIQGATSQSVNFFQIQDSNGTPILYFDTGYNLNVNQSLVAGAGVSFAAGNGALQVGSGNPTFVASSGELRLTTYGTGKSVIVIGQEATQNTFVVQGFTSQSGDLQRWQNVSATVLASISASGNIDAVTYSVAGSPGIDATITTAQLTALGSQGSMTFSKGILTAQTPAT